MAEYESTLKIVRNLDRPAIELKLREAKAVAEKHELSDIAALLGGIAGKSRDEMARVVNQCLGMFTDMPEYGKLKAELELVLLNLPNLK